MVSPRLARAAPAAALAAFFLLLTWPVIAIDDGRAATPGPSGISEAYDEQKHHLPAIRAIDAAWPDLIAGGAFSATGPGYHVAMAMFARAVSADLRVMRFASSLFGLALVLLVWRHMDSRIGPWPAVGCTLPLACSQYVLSAASWLTTDLAAWVGVVIALGLVASENGASVRAGVGSALAAAMAIFVRQMHAWLIVPLAIASRTNPISALAAVALPLSALLMLATAWGGLVPPAFREHRSATLNGASMVLSLGLIGVYGPFFLGAFRAGLRGMWRDPLTWMLAGGALAVAVAAPTSVSHAAGRGGGSLWTLAKYGPVIGDRSLVMIAAAVAGALVLLAAWRACRIAGRPRSAVILIAAFAAFSVTHLFVFPAWPRYFEPLVLIVLAWLAADAASGRVVSGAMLAGPLLLALAQLAIAAVTLYARVLR